MGAVKVGYTREHKLAHTLTLSPHFSSWNLDPSA